MNEWTHIINLVLWEIYYSLSGKSYIITLILSHVYTLNKQLLSLAGEVVREKTNYVPPLPLKSQSSFLLQPNWEKYQPMVLLQRHEHAVEIHDHFNQIGAAANGPPIGFSH